MNISDQIIDGLKKKFRFKSTKGEWMQQGQCPQCDKWELYAAAKDPRIVKCGRVERCGWEDTVRNLLPDIFEDWSKRAPANEENPTATADAYLLHERGLNLMGLRAAYTQETYFNADLNASSATVRFALPNDSWWERIIDKPGRFPRKANFKFGSSWKGHWWAPPTLDYDKLALADDILFAEGIFDAMALCQVGKTAVSLMSVNNYPEAALDLLRQAVGNGPAKKHPPRLVFAFDVGKAGVDYTRKFVKRARAEGWDATAMQVRPDGEGTKLDWNDLLLRHQQWRGEPEKAPLSEQAFEEYLYNGAITIAETARDKAKLIMERKILASFQFRHDNRLWAANVKYDENNMQELQVREIANCAFRILYRERDDIADETNYFLQVDFPDGQKTEKARFSSAACAASGEFKKRLMAFAGMWSGTADQLDSLMRRQTRRLKTVEPIPFTGYSPPHKAWVLGDLAVREGVVIKVNAENYFDFGKSAVKLRSAERILDIKYDPDNLAFDWADDVWAAWGSKGLITVAFFVMSLFAVQIRKRHSSLGFLEITGLPGAGKTTLVSFCWKLFGRLEYEGFDPNKGTMAGVARNFQKVANLPVGLIEGNRNHDGKQSHGRQFDWSELLTLFNGRSPRVVGAKSNGNETYEPPFLGSIYLMQNERIDAHPAVLERLMSFNVDKASWSETTRSAAIRCEGRPIEQLSGNIIHILKQADQWLTFFFERVQHHEADMRRRVAGLHNARCIKNHSQLGASVEALGRLFPNIRAEWIDETLKHVDAMALDRQNSAGGDHPIVADFWEKVDWLLANEGPDAWGNGESINLSRTPDKVFAINLNAFEAKCRMKGLVPPRMDELKRHLTGSKSRKFLASKPINPPSGKSIYCWVFDNPDDASGTRLI
jgi:hypothetical protein